MTIDSSGDWWVGSEPSDIEGFLAAFTESECAYPATTFRLVKCACGGDRFEVQRAGSVTRRACASCGHVVFVCRQSEDWEEAEEEDGAEPYSCVDCESLHANVAVGFADYTENPALDAVKWFYVGVRCAECGILGCFNDGKVGRGPANAVYESC